MPVGRMCLWLWSVPVVVISLRNFEFAALKLEGRDNDGNDS